MRYGLERLLFRLSLSPYANEFVVKGAMMFLVWKVEPNLMTVIETVRDFIMPVVTPTAGGGKFNPHWPKGGPWQTRK